MRRHPVAREQERLHEPRSPCPALAVAIDASVYRRRAAHEIAIDLAASSGEEAKESVGSECESVGCEIAYHRA